MDNLRDKWGQSPQINYNTIRKSIKGGLEAVRKVVEEWGYRYDKDLDVFIKNTPKQEPEQVPVVSLKPIDNNRPLIVTSYLLGTDVPKHILLSLMVHAQQLGAEICVIPHRYHNPTTLQASIREETDVYIDPAVKPYLSWERFTIYNHEILADVRIPINNLHCLDSIKSFSTTNSVVGHPTQSMATKPVIEGLPPTLWSTGTISKIDPADNLTAKKAEFHYKFGWIVVSPDGSSRNVHLCKNGNFTDLGDCWNSSTKEWSRNEKSTVATVWGDYHFGQTSPEATTWAVLTTVSFSGNYVVLHDYFDAATVNPHASREERSRLFDGDLKKEVLKAVEHLKLLADNFKICLVQSNHNDMLSRYFNTTTLQDMTINEQEVLRWWLDSLKSPELMLRHLADEESRIEWAAETVYGIQLATHGHKGINGGRGTVKGFFTIGAKLIFGHTHTPAMVGAVSNVGTLSKKDLGYNKGGASSWKPSIARVDCYGKVQHLVYFGEGWA